MLTDISLSRNAPDEPVPCPCHDPRRFVSNGPGETNVRRYRWIDRPRRPFSTCRLLANAGNQARKPTGVLGEAILFFLGRPISVKELGQFVGWKHDFQVLLAPMPFELEAAIAQRNDRRRWRIDTHDRAEHQESATDKILLYRKSSVRIPPGPQTLDFNECGNCGCNPLGHGGSFSNYSVAEESRLEDSLRPVIGFGGHRWALTRVIGSWRHLTLAKRRRRGE